MGDNRDQECSTMDVDNMGDGRDQERLMMEYDMDISEPLCKLILTGLEDHAGIANLHVLEQSKPLCKLILKDLEDHAEDANNWKSVALHEEKTNTLPS